MDIRGRVLAPPGDPDTTPIIVDAVGATHSGFQIRGTQAGEHLGADVANGGDALVDGVPDVLIGAPTYDSGGNTDAGRVLQTTQAIPSGIYTADAVGTTLGGVIWTGEAAGDQLGYAVAGVSDVTGDGYDDVVFGAPFVDPIVDGSHPDRRRRRLPDQRASRDGTFRDAERHRRWDDRRGSRIQRDGSRRECGIIDRRDVGHQRRRAERLHRRRAQHERGDGHGVHGAPERRASRRRVRAVGMPSCRFRHGCSSRRCRPERSPRR